MENIDPNKLKENAEKASILLKNMSHPGRLMVLCHLMNQEYSVGSLNQLIPLSQSALSQHLSSLRDAGLVETRREGQTIYYRLSSKEVTDVLQVLYHIYCNPQEKQEEI